METLTSKQIPLSEFRKLIRNRKIYVRNGDIRFVVTKKSIQDSLKAVQNDMLFTVEYDTKKVFVEYTLQII